MGFFKRLLGICSTPLASDDAWVVNDSKVTLDLRRVGCLAKSGGAVRLEGPGLKYRILVIRGDDGKFHAFRNRCSHAGHRRLDPVPGEGIIRCCSIGQSEFDYDGKRLAGSASDPIQPLTVTVETHTLNISLD